MTNRECVPGYHVSSSVVVNPDELAQEWCALQERTDCSYFQSWGWIGVWLKTIAADLKPQVIRVRYRGSLVGLGIFVRRDIRRRLFISSSASFLNEYPFDGRNMSIEYNGLLADSGHRQAVYSEVIRHLFGADPGLDEVFLGAVDVDAVALQDLPHPVCKHAQISLRLLEESHTWAVCLDSLGPGMDAYIDTLSKNRKAQVRRSFRLYEASGPLCLEQAEDLDTAHEFFSGLKKLHTLRWQKEGRQGVFANPVWENFHKSLVESRFSEGEIQLLRVRNDSTVVGYLYNLVWRRHVYVLQTGFAPEREKGMMPGYVMHAMAIGHNSKQGMLRYDLMHGNELYKRIMCKQYHKLQWVSLQRRRLRFVAENLVLRVKRSLLSS